MFKENLKKNWKMFVISSIAVLTPVIAGIFLWNKLPERIAVHFNINNQPDNFASRGFTVFGIPFILLAIHVFACCCTFFDKKSDNIAKKPLTLLFWYVPTVSAVVMTVIYLFALKMPVNVGFVCIALIGVLFVVIGNIMPKAGQNSTFGVRIKPTLASSENWFHTHRFAGALMAAGGIVMIATAFLCNPFIIIGVVLIVAVLPVAYSYRYAAKHKPAAN